MNFSEMEGNEKLVARLSGAINNNNVSHAYIFESEASLDKKSFAEAFTKAVLCKEKPGVGCDNCPICAKIDHGNHEDLIYVEASGMSVKDEAIEELQNRLKTKPFGDRNIAIINNADTMTLRAQNRLLKTLEEPAAGTILILLSENIENLTQTILSRCVKYRINYYGKESCEGMMDVAKQVIDMVAEDQPFYKVKETIADIIKDNEKSAAFLDAMEREYRELLLGKDSKSRLYKKEQIYDSVAAVEDARRQLQQGVSKSYALKNLIIKIGG